MGMAEDIGPRDLLIGCWFWRGGGDQTLCNTLVLFTTYVILDRENHPYALSLSSYFPVALSVSMERAMAALVVSGRNQTADAKQVVIVFSSLT